MRRWVARRYWRQTRARSGFITALGSCATVIAVVCACTVAWGSVRQGSATSYYRLVQYPGAGFGGFYTQIVRARRTIDMEMYELEDRTAERDLVAAAARGVGVRVLLDRDFSGAEANRGAAKYLAAHGVRVAWAPPGYIFHIKTTTFDGTTSDISTANLVSKYYRTTRDAEIIDTNSPQVRAIEETFSNDWTAGASGSPRSQTVQAPGLIWSPNTGSGTAESALVKQISSARKTIDFESEELADPAIYRALAAVARRGVGCRVVMTRSSAWDPALRVITEAGCRVHLFPDSSTALYIHEKLILDDHGTARESLLIGSQNASVTSLTRNRELGIILNRAYGGADAITVASATFDSDFRGVSPRPTPTPTPTPAACYPKTDSGNCYEPGEECRGTDHGMSGVAGNGEAIVCESSYAARARRASRRGTATRRRSVRIHPSSRMVCSACAAPARDAPAHEASSSCEIGMAISTPSSCGTP
jgi:cardiolipin synthase A/B